MDQKIRWYSSWDEVKSAAALNRKKIFTAFMIRSSKPCKIFEQQLTSEGSMIDLLKNFYCVKINPLVEPHLMDQYGIKGVPTVLLLDANGKVLDRIQGLLTTQSLIDQ